MLRKRGQLSHQFAYAILLVTVLIVSIMAYKYITGQQAPAPSNLFPPSSQPSNTNPFLSEAPAAQVDCSQEKTNTEMDVCWQTKAVDEKNHIYCNSIENANPFVSKDACINLVAHEKKDKALCSLIKNPDIRKNCEEIK